MTINGAIFDMDGTLLDSMSAWDDIAEEYLRVHGKTPRTDLKTVFNQLTIAQSAEYFRTEYGISGTTTEIVSGINRMIEHFYFNEVEPREGVPELLETLCRRGVHMCVATATDRYLAEGALQRCGLYRYLEGVFTCSEIGVGKSEPVVFERALMALGTLHTDTFVFEDSLYAAKTAAHAGFQVVGIYDPAEIHQQELKQTAKYYLNSMAEFQQYLGRE